MNLRLLFLYPVMRSLGWILLGTAALAALQTGVLNSVILGPLKDHMDQSVAHLVFSLVVPIPVFCALVYAVTRSCYGGAISEYELSLPVRGRTLLAYRILARLILVLAPLAATILVALWITTEPVGRRIIAICGLNLGSGLLLILFLHLLQSRRGGFWLSLALALSGGLMFAGIFVESPWYGMALLGLALVAGLVLYGIRNAPHYLFREKGKVAAAVDHEVLTPRQALRRTILRHTVLHKSSMSMAFMVVFFMVVWGVQPGNLLLKYTMPFFFAVSLSSANTMGLLKLDHLPLSRRRLFPYIILPGLCCLWLGVLALDLIPYRLASQQGPAVELDFMDVSLPGEEEDYRNQVKVPHEEWNMSLGLPDPIVSEWGESHAPLPHRILPGLPLYVFNPYGVGKDSSLRFTAWQLHRALEAVYGDAIPENEIQESYIHMNVLKKLDAQKGWEASWSAWQDGRTTSKQINQKIIKFFFVGLAWLALHFILFGLIISRTRDKWRKFILKGCLWGCGALLLLGYPIFLFFRDMEGARALLMSMPRFLDHWWLGNNLVAWGLILLVMYKLVERRFLRMELPELPRGAGRQLARKALDNL